MISYLASDILIMFHLFMSFQSATLTHLNFSNFYFLFPASYFLKFVEKVSKQCKFLYLY